MDTHITRSRRRLLFFPLSVGIMIAAAGCAGSEASSLQARGQELTITAKDFTFAPSEPSIRAGLKTELIFHNQGKLQHDVVIAPAGAKVTPADGHSAGAGHGDQPGQAQASGSDHATIHATAEPNGKTNVEFTLQKGVYEMLCTIPGHLQAGMRGLLRVI